MSLAATDKDTRTHFAHRTPHESCRWEWCGRKTRVVVKTRRSRADSPARRPKKETPPATRAALLLALCSAAVISLAARGRNPDGLPSTPSSCAVAAQPAVSNAAAPTQNGNHIWARARAQEQNCRKQQTHERIKRYTRGLENRARGAPPRAADRRGTERRRAFNATLHTLGRPRPAVCAAVPSSERSAAFR